MSAEDTRQNAAPGVHDDATIVIVATNEAVSSTRAVSPETKAQSTPDIEHVSVEDDPREWSRGRKTFTLIIISAASLIATLGVSIYNRGWCKRIYSSWRASSDKIFAAGINDIKAQLHATDQEISLTLSIFVLVQGSTPLVWSAVSEIRGRKFVYLTSITLYVIGSGIAGSAKSPAVLIAMRLVQGMGGSAVLSVGAATLADIYEPQERGTVVGIYYATPLLGPSLGPLIGGLLTQLFSWRATFYCMAIFAGLSLLSILFYRDTFRRERSLAYQCALQARKGSHATIDDKSKNGHEKREPDCEKAEHRTRENGGAVGLSIWDVNPIPPLWVVLRRINNLAILLPSSLLFGLMYCITYTAVRTFAKPPYSYNAMDIGLVLLSFGIGSMVGSVAGGRWSDHILGKLKAANGGQMCSEDRLQSTKPMIGILPLSLIGYAWMAEEKVHIAGICIMLFLIGVSSIWIYSSTLAYIVDANTGRSSTAIACNSFGRGFAGFVFAELAVPLQDSLGDGGLYTLWAGLMLFGAGMVLLTLAKGSEWRQAADARESVQRDGKTH